jgi:hypothetical protein
MDSGSIILAMGNSNLLESRNASELLKTGANFEVFDGLAKARKESLALTYKIRLKTIQKDNSDYAQRLASSIGEFVEALEKDDPEYLRIITVSDNESGKYHLWLIPKTNQVIGCMYTEAAKNE